MAVMVILSMALNSYWFLLMIRTIIRVFSRASQQAAAPIEKVELVKADHLAMDNEVDDGTSTQGSCAGDIPEEGMNEDDEPRIEEEV